VTAAAAAKNLRQKNLYYLNSLSFPTKSDFRPAGAQPIHCSEGPLLTIEEGKFLPTERHTQNKKDQGRRPVQRTGQKQGLGHVNPFYTPGFPGFSISERMLFQLMAIING
jgi:hypothetical protein